MEESEKANRPATGETAAKLLAYVKENYGVSPDYPWIKYPDFAVLRHNGGGKWFALVASLPASALKLPGNGETEFVNVKCDPELIYSLRQAPGFLPAYHMNKEHWITVLLDGSVPTDMIFELLDLSYRLTFAKGKS